MDKNMIIFSLAFLLLFSVVLFFVREDTNRQLNVACFEIGYVKRSMDESKGLEFSSELLTKRIKQFKRW